MKKLYEFMQDLYSKYNSEFDRDFDEFVGCVLDGSFNIESMHEGFFCDEYLCNFKMDYKIDHKNKRIELLFKES